MARAVALLLFALVCGQAAANIVPKYGFFSSLWDSLYDHKQTGWPFEKFDNSLPRQSPIDLITSEAITKSLPELNIIETNLKGHQARLYNSGHTAYVYMNDEPANRPYLEGGPLLNDKFIFEQLHFHWGSEDVWGSEHMVDGEGKSVEIHLVHWNSKYGTFENASTQADGLSVLTVFAEGGDAENTLLTPLHSLLGSVSTAKSSAHLDTADALQWVISALDENHEYYTYPGSLTTEPYTENVAWIILPKAIKLSNTQLHSFRTLHSEHANELIADNKRNIQPIHRRPIIHSTNIRK